MYICIIYIYIYILCILYIYIYICAREIPQASRPTIETVSLSRLNHHNKCVYMYICICIERER